MARFFALPVVATVLALVGVRMVAAGAPADKPLEIVVSLPVQEPEAPAEPTLPQEKPAEPAPPLPAPKPEPVIIVLEPLPAPVAPALQPAAAPPVVVTQTTIVNNTTTNIFYPVVYPVVVQPEPEPRVEVIETPVLVVVCGAHRRAGCCLPAPRRPVHKPQDTFFKSIPFLPPTPRGPRYNP